MNCIQVQLSMVPTKEEINLLPSQPCPTRVSRVLPFFGGPALGGGGSGGSFLGPVFFGSVSARRRPSARSVLHQGKLEDQGKLADSNGVGRCYAGAQTWKQSRRFR